MKHEIMLGGDFSHHMYMNIDPKLLSFVMLKATEGVTYKDESMNKYLVDIATAYADKEIDTMPFIGFYHFARPERNAFLPELYNFIDAIQPHIGNCLIALDWEDKALRTQQPEIWAIQWLREAQRKTGTTPLFYCSESELKNYPNIVKEFPIWVAHYHNQSKRDNCINYAMWQVTSNPFDIDVFNGGRKEMVSLIKGLK